MNKWFNLYVIGLLLVCCDTSYCSNTDFTHADNVLNMYENYLLQLSELSFTSEATIVTTMPNRSIPVSKYVSHIYLTDQNIKVSETINNDDNSEQLQHEALITNQDNISAYSTDEKELTVTATNLFVNTQDKRLQLLREWYFFGYEYFGINSKTDMESVLSILKQSNLTVAKNDGLLVLTATNEKYLLKLWFNAENEGAPSKIVFTLNPKYTRIYSMISLILEADDFSRVSGIAIPTKMLITRVKAVPKMQQNNDYNLLVQNTDQIEERYDPSTCGERIENIDVNWKDFRFGNIADSKFCMEQQFKIPDGTPVSMQDVPQIEYIWMDGKIVPKTDERMLAIARGGHKFMPGPKESRFWMILLGIVGILVGGGWKLYDFWTADREPASPQLKDQAG